ncbi:hypothetical protein F5890DRAFT_1549371 [Lentinula detonsa]|uniref:Eukaryotic translation initiation factor 3 subunit F n=1 Tax=Lentinula detonsa TaxID=2804962 RepID=A0AA38Q8Z9_9AGAR|nr:hypothetical protein F5890DRAFT_1549371 [Lentinula detonsa]
MSTSQINMTADRESISPSIYNDVERGWINVKECSGHGSSASTGGSSTISRGHTFGRTATGNGKIANPGPAGAISFAATALLLSLFNVQAGSVEHPEVVVSMVRRCPPQPCSQSYAFYHLHNSRHSQHLAIQSRRNAHSPFAVLHSETSEQVAVDMDYHPAMYELHHKVNPREIIVGWYSTGSNLNTYSALIQNFYSQETGPHQAIHACITRYWRWARPAVGVFPKPENCVFVPVPVELRFRDSERSGVDLLTSTALSSSSTSSQPLSDLTILESSSQNVISMIDRVLTYVRAVLAGEAKGDAAIGRYLMDTLGESTDDLEKGGFNGRLQDTLMISYLANLVRAQAEVSSRLALVTAS